MQFAFFFNEQSCQYLLLATVQDPVKPKLDPREDSVI